MDIEVFGYLNDIGSKVTVKKDELIITEGEASDCFFVILGGSGQVSRQASELCLEDKYYFTGSLDQSFKVFKKGRIIGESGFFQSGARTQTVTALEDSELLKVNYEDLKKLKKEDADKYNLIVMVLGEHVTIRLRNSNRILVNDLLAGTVASHKRQYFSNILLTLALMGAFLLLTIDLWRYAYGALPPIGDTLLSCAVIFSIFLCLNINKNKPPLHFFGLNLNNLKGSIYDGVIYSIIMSLVGTLFKYLYLPLSTDLFTGNFYKQDLTKSLIGVTLYFLFTILQELIARGIVQGAFTELLSKDTKGVWLSILLSNMLFASMHAIMFPMTSVALIMFIGLPWGWLYYKHKSLVGPVVSHTLVGVYGIWFLGLF